MLPVPTIRSPHQSQNTIGQVRTRSQQIQPHIPHIPHIQPHIQSHTPQIPQFRFMVPPSPYINSPQQQLPFPRARRATERRAKTHWLVSLHGVTKSERSLLNIPSVARLELVTTNNTMETGIALTWVSLTNSAVKSLGDKYKKKNK